jgi:hypothetical protein
MGGRGCGGLLIEMQRAAVLWEEGLSEIRERGAERKTGESTVRSSGSESGCMVVLDYESEER